MAAETPLAPTVLAAYRTAFVRDVTAGHRRQIVMPQALVGTFLLSVLWIATPHASRPWLYHSRWLIAALVVALNYEQVTRASSANPAWAVASGLMATHGSMLCLQHLIFTNPQRDAARAIRVSAPHAAGRDTTPLRDTPEASSCKETAPALVSRHITTNTASTASTISQPADAHNHGDRIYYIWQRFPTHASFAQRFAWAADLVLSFRGAGWSSSISVLPTPPRVRPVPDGKPIDPKSIPFQTNIGYEYITPPSAFFRHRLKLFTFAYLVLDFLGTFMMQDPYFVMGRERAVGYPLPSHLAGLPPWRLEAYRQLFSISGAFAAVAAGASLVDMVHYSITSCWIPSRCIPWMYASAFGSVAEVFDKGLAGFWGCWWHQTFRQQFFAPATYLLRNGIIHRRTWIGNIVALVSTFALSGLLHASGSRSAMAESRPWRQFAFFLLQAVGILVQQSLGALVRMFAPRRHGAALRSAGSVTFAILWLYATASLFNDDMAAMGIWLLEPVPVSVFRGLGLGFPGEAVWRWDSHYLMRWHSGRHWWQSGVAV